VTRRTMDPLIIGTEKVVPPIEVMADRLDEEVRDELERRITAQVLRKARIGDRVERAFRERESDSNDHIRPIDQGEQRVEIDRLDEVVIKPRLLGEVTSIFVAVTGDGD
jgi:hypothetical protein